MKIFLIGLAALLGIGVIGEKDKQEKKIIAICFIATIVSLTVICLK